MNTMTALVVDYLLADLVIPRWFMGVMILLMLPQIVRSARALHKSFWGK